VIDWWKASGGWATIVIVPRNNSAAMGERVRKLTNPV
jgi:hypothetical protein